MKHLTTFLWLLVGTLSTESALAEEPLKLSQTETFAFGGVGFAGTTSAGELEFREVMARSTRRQDFLQVLATGTPAARCYALVGLKAVDEKVFQEKAAALQADTTPVKTMAGCMSGEQALRSVVHGIAKGQYDKAAWQTRK